MVSESLAWKRTQRRGDQKSKSMEKNCGQSASKHLPIHASTFLPLHRHVKVIPLTFFLVKKVFFWNDN